ncbi:hypothetical protein VCRA2113O358_170032 [Vibrio crassostreae]|nr:hypothetical protein VCRA2113O354_170032 [Vibrio crassostreae]CAK1810862.1 hypothetical protein VCRA2113O358_170032 [Vibrio crassostreae]
MLGSFHSSGFFGESATKSWFSSQYRSSNTPRLEQSLAIAIEGSSNELAINSPLTLIFIFKPYFYLLLKVTFTIAAFVPCFYPLKFNNLNKKPHSEIYFESFMSNP